MKKLVLTLLAIVFFGLKMNAQSYSTLEPPTCDASNAIMMAKTSIFTVSFNGADFTELTFPNGQTLTLKKINLGSEYKNPRCIAFEGSVNGKTYIIGRTTIVDYDKLVTNSIYAICNDGEKCEGRQEIIEFVKSISRR